MQNAEFRVQNERQTTNVKPRTHGARRQIPNLPASGCPRPGLAAPLATAGGEMRATYGNRRLWITFWRRFWGWILGDFWEVTGPGGSARAVFSPKSPECQDGQARICTFLQFFAGFWPVLGAFYGDFGLLASMSCAYLYVHNFPRTRVSRNRGRGIRGRRPAPPQAGKLRRRLRRVEANLAFHKETAWDGQCPGF